MDFDKIKALMDDENHDDFLLPERLTQLKKSQMPIARIRQTMKSEIAIQLVCFAILFVYPYWIRMYELPRAAYLISIFVTFMMTLGYLAKMIWFLRRTSQVGTQTKETILRFIHDIKLTMEVYKTGIIASSLVLPIPVAALTLGTIRTGADRFSEWFLLQMSTPTLLLVMVGYILCGVVIYYITVTWADKLYGVHVRKLEGILAELEA